MSDLSKIKLIVADMDGTLLDDQKQLDEGIFDVVKKLQEKDIMFTLASGRNVHIMKEYIEQLNLRTPYITNNGANIFVYDQCIDEINMLSNELYKVFYTLQLYDIPYIAYSNDAVYLIKEDEKFEFFLKRLRNKIEICNVMNYSEILKYNIFKVVLLSEDITLMNEVMDNINRQCRYLKCIRSEGSIYTITHIEATKGEALKKIMKQLHIKKNQVLVFGDNFNDLSMFKVAEISVAMNNAQREVKKSATHSTSSNNMGGVSEYISKRVLKNRK